MVISISEQRATEEDTMARVEGDREVHDVRFSLDDYRRDSSPAVKYAETHGLAIVVDSVGAWP